MTTGTGGTLAIVVAPDGGWGWVVVLAAFYCNMIVDGIVYSFGLMMKDIAINLNQSPDYATLVGSLLTGFYLIAGPFVSALVNSFGFRVVTISGSILSCVAFAVGAYVDSIYQLMFFYGFLGGIGFSMIYVCAVLIPGFYFDKWRALATGIAVCGSGIGTFVLAPLTDHLVKNYGWRVSMLTQAGLALSCGIFGILFRPLEPTIVEVPPNNPIVVEPEKPENEPLLVENNGVQRRYSIDKFSISKSGAPTAEAVYKHLSGRITPDQNISLSCYSLNADLTLKGKLSPENKENKLSVASLRSRRNTLTPSLLAHPMDRDDRFFGGSLNKLPQYSSQIGSLNYTMSVTRIPSWNDIIEEESKLKFQSKNVNRKHSTSFWKYYKSTMHTLKTMLDFSILMSPSFLVLTCSGFLTLMGFFVPFMFITDMATKNNMDKQMAVYLVSIIGIANTAGRILCGWISSYDSIDPIFVNNLSLTFGGIYTFIFPFIPYSVVSYVMYASLFGFSMACFASLRSTMIVELTGLELLTNAFGVLLMFQGLAAAIGSPLLGKFNEATGSYDMSFYMAGLILFLSAIICYPLKRVKKWEDNRKKKPINV
ncbi:monocarboxylate transporter 2 isoform X2 [Daktulosphaira vitifoliae]|nr:monocarboxylate transporter 2 isoform X2 [Daktulosphaira vitifoliae]XP_050523150.1 monocarboxylate transporter 2 isoform X2 [Daktulosphaira vitifoliae]XP_050523151.1 monocarboxylate transporter 2 isoform X2 [Daktulosphaira vitifoliae]XP_050523152.1 monocarboxylate transporter 2 isoform X2 [Daktulosphaira vitifoliae]XP_050523153.1 monocarboxylate transporter 2 isoform X2 [Daktulosphaira vitifoliae]